MTLLNDICGRNLNLKLGKERLIGDIYHGFNSYQKIEELEPESMNVLPCLSNNRRKSQTAGLDKALSR